MLQIRTRRGGQAQVVNRLTGEPILGVGAPPLVGIRHLRDGDLWNDHAQIAQRATAQGVETVLRWRGESGEHQLVTHWHSLPDGDLLVAQRAECAAGGLVGMQWGLEIPPVGPALARDGRFPPACQPGA